MRQVLGFVLVLTATGCGNIHDSVSAKIHTAANAKIRGTGEPITKTFQIESFQKIRTGAAMHFVVSQGKSPKLTISAQKEILASLVPTVSGGELVIKTPESYSTDREVLVTIETPELVSLQTNGASKVEASGDWSEDIKIVSDGASSVTLAAKTKSLQITAQGAAKLSYTGSTLSSFEVNANGGSNIKIFPEVEAKNITLNGGSRLTLESIRASSTRWDLNGGSQLVISSGSVASLDLVANGGSRVSAETIPIEDAIVDLNGAASANLSIKKSVRGSVNGAAQLRYGAATVAEIKTGGAGHASR